MEYSIPNDVDVIMYDIASKSLVNVNVLDVLQRMYELEINVPTVEQVKEYMSIHTDDISKYFADHIEIGIAKIVDIISRIDNKVPLYDIYTENLYLVERSDIYDKVMKEYHRFPTKKMLDMLTERQKSIEMELHSLNFDIHAAKNGASIDVQKISKEKQSVFQYGQMLSGTHRKISLCLKFMNSFNPQIMLNTYVNALYTYSRQLGKNITLCKRPSFAYQFKHIIPYYTRSEIINIALNMGIIKADDKYYGDDDVRNLCQLIKENDINSKILLDHQSHIIKNKMIGLVQYYSLQGSYFMNQYLRGQTNYNYKNEYLESLIQPMWKLILDAPPLDKKYIAYRFIQDDYFISDLNIGDTYTERGFMSTTRDPFYQNKSYKFGWILLKIRLPVGIKGCALCIEAISLFQKEEEIILPPNTTLKLLNKDDKSIYYHTDKSITKKVRTMYEFEIVGRSDISFVERPIYTEMDEPVDFLKIKKMDTLTIEERIHGFSNRYVNPMNQFPAIIGDRRFTITSEWYDSLSVYKRYYASSSKNGYSMYTVYNNHLLFMIEIGEDLGNPFMYVNYNIKYSTLDRDKVIGSENFMNFIASIAYHFDIQSIIVYNDYVSCDYLNPIDDAHSFAKFYGGTYCVDFYEYFKHGTKKYADIGILNIELIPKFRYHQLDLLWKIQPLQILRKKDDRMTDDRIFQLYKKTYMNCVPKIEDNLASFYIWIVENHCFILDKLLDWFAKIPQYASNNPFQNDYYTFNAMAYLYNRNKIQSIPISLNTMAQSEMVVKSKSGHINRYRISDDVRRR